MEFLCNLTSLDYRPGICPSDEQSGGRIVANLYIDFKGIEKELYYSESHRRLKFRKGDEYSLDHEKFVRFVDQKKEFSLDFADHGFYSCLIRIDSNQYISNRNFRLSLALKGSQNIQCNLKVLINEKTEQKDSKYSFKCPHGFFPTLEESQTWCGVDFSLNLSSEKFRAIRYVLINTNFYLENW